MKFANPVVRRVCSITIACAWPWTMALHAQSEAEANAAAAPEGLLPVPDYSGDRRTRVALTGDWGGLRQKWAEHGFTIDSTWTQYGQGVDSGGLSNSWEFGGSFDAVFRADLMRMQLLPGALVTMRVESRYGESANSNAGMILPINTQSFFPLTSTADEDLPIAITELNYTQFLSDKFGVLMGKIQTMDGDQNEFASGRGRSQFMNFAFVQNPITALTAPYSTLAAGVVYLPSSQLQVSSALMNLADSSTTSGFDDFGEGGVWTAETDYKWDGGLPGGMNVGGMYAFDADFTKLNDTLGFTPGVGPTVQKQSTSWCAYVSSWQYVSVEGKPAAPVNGGDGRADLQGFGVFTRLGFADQDTNPIDWTASVGVGGRGLLESRSDDTYGLGYFYSDLQQPNSLAINALEDHTAGTELYYDIALAASVALTLDAQWVSSAFGGIDDAFILGFRLSAQL